MANDEEKRLSPKNSSEARKKGIRFCSELTIVLRRGNRRRGDGLELGVLLCWWRQLLGASEQTIGESGETTLAKASRVEEGRAGKGLPEAGRSGEGRLSKEEGLAGKGKTGEHGRRQSYTALGLKLECVNIYGI
ncbi:hypothetical protein ACLOJK_005474 [Asimina triloba]